MLCPSSITHRHQRKEQACRSVEAGKAILHAGFVLLLPLAIGGLQLALLLPAQPVSAALQAMILGGYRCH